MRLGRREKALTQLLDTAKGEREIHAYLKKNDHLILQAFNRAWNTHHVISEFKVGTDFRSDFLILSAHSGAWLATFIELESHRARLYNRVGIPTRPLNIAKRQLAEWRDYAAKFPDVLRHQFAEQLRSRSECSWCSVAGKFGSGAEEIASKETYVEYHFHIVIGRSTTLTEEERRYRQLDTSWGGSEIATYDRFLAFARRNDTADREIRESWRAAGMKPPRRLLPKPPPAFGGKGSEVRSRFSSIFQLSAINSHRPSRRHSVKCEHPKMIRTEYGETFFIYRIGVATRLIGCRSPAVTDKVWSWRLGVTRTPVAASKAMRHRRS